MSFNAALRLSLFVGPLLFSSATADEAENADAPPADVPQYTLRYKFRPGELVRWKVVHQALVRTTVSGTTQTAETRSESVKMWQIKEVAPDAGQATFVHSVESVDMRQSVSGRQDVRYNSATDAVAPAEFEEVSKSVGVPLSVIVLDTRGHVIKRSEERAQPNANPGEMTVPLPEEAVALNAKWSLPHDANVRQKDGTTKQVKTRQEFTLAEVKDGIATIRVATVVLTPIRDPALEAQLIQHVTDGTIRFDIEAGRVIGQQVDIDKRVIGFQGEASSMHYVTRFTEELMSTAAATASKPAPAAKPGAKEKSVAVADASAPPVVEDTPAKPVDVKAPPLPPGKAPKATRKQPAKKVTKAPSRTPAKSAAKPKPKTTSRPQSTPQNRR